MMKQTIPFLLTQQATTKNETDKRKELFQNRYFERLTHTQIVTPISLFTIITIALLYYSNMYKNLSIMLLVNLFLAGVLFFTLVEYLVHRYVFHILTNTPKKVDFQYKFHGVHHAFPKDEDRLAMPPILSMTIISVFFCVFYIILHEKVYGFIAGFAMGYASYLLVHYLVHAFNPPKNLFKILWINHGIHHYKNDSVAFGVSSPLWDWVFGTLPPKTKKKNIIIEKITK